MDQPLGNRVAFRLNGVYENSDSFRKYVDLRRYGINPTLTIAASPQTQITLSYEHFRDDRVADRGIPSWQGRPVEVNISTFYGNPGQSNVHARGDLGSATIDRQAGRFHIRNRLLFGGYDRGYQNFVPGRIRRSVPGIPRRLAAGASHCPDRPLLNS